MFEGFDQAAVDVGGGVRLRVHHGGCGYPVVLLHGHPRTHTTWHRVAPLLVAAGHTVVCPDLRGYGESSKPATTADHAPYSKRTMAGDVLALMRQLGHERFAVVGHDRGSYVAARLALDAPQAVTHLAVLDSVPIGEALARADARFAAAWWHWFFYAQPDKPEQAILADPDSWYGGDPDRMGADNYADYRRAIRNPATVRAMLEDYRAGLGVDRDADDADRAAGRQITCPTLVLWSTGDDMAGLYGDVLAVLGTLEHRPARRTHRQRTPHGRRRTRPARRRADDLSRTRVDDPMNRADRRRPISDPPAGGVTPAQERGAGLQAGTPGWCRPA